MLILALLAEKQKNQERYKIPKSQSPAVFSVYNAVPEIYQVLGLAFGFGLASGLATSRWAESDAV